MPDNVSFSTKPQLAVEMIERALAAGVPFRWVAADSVYGVGDIERNLRQAGKGYVLGVNSNHWFASWGKPQRVAGTAEEIAKTQRRSDWRRLSAGAGTKGPRLHDWCYRALPEIIEPAQCSTTICAVNGVPPRIRAEYDTHPLAWSPRFICQSPATRRPIYIFDLGCAHQH